MLRWGDSVANSHISKLEQKNKEAVQSRGKGRGDRRKTKRNTPGTSGEEKRETMKKNTMTHKVRTVTRFSNSIPSHFLGQHFFPFASRDAVLG